MPRISRARRTLEQLLSEESDPQKRAELATKLARVVDAEGRERARRRRAKRDKPPAPQPTVDDSDEEFILDDSPTVTTPLRPDPLAEKRLEIEARAPIHKPEPEDAPEEEAPRPTGFTRVLNVFEFPSEAEVYPQSPFYNDLTFVDPLAQFGTACVDSDEFSGGRFASDAAQDAEDAADALWREQMEKLYGK